MKRENEPLVLKKPWEEMTEEERQTVRESWKYRLPEEFDVFCINDMYFKPKSKGLDIPGNLYISGNVCCIHSFFPPVNVKDDFFVGQNIESGNITVGGNFIVDGEVDTLDITVGKAFIVGSDVFCCNLAVHGNCFVDGKVDCYDINVNGIFDCYDIEPIDYKIQVSDYICQCYEDKK